MSASEQMDARGEQYNTTFHATRAYVRVACTMQDAVRSRSIISGSLCSLFIGFTAVKNTVCLSLLEFCPPAINPEFVMECQLTAHPV